MRRRALEREYVTQPTEERDEKEMERYRERETDMYISTYRYIESEGNASLIPKVAGISRRLHKPPAG